MTMDNPYNYHLPVQDEAMFFGRTQLLRRLTSGLMQSRPLSAAVFGGRRSGKTSLLRKLERDMRAGRPAAGNRKLIPWYYDPQAGYPISSSDDFFLLALDVLRRTLYPAHAPSAERVSAEQVENAYESALRLGPANAFAESFRLLTGELDERIRLVLLVDEAESLLTAPWGSDLRPNLRNLLSNSEIANDLALVMSGSTAFHAQVAERDSPLENILTRYVLHNLTHEETLALAREPNKGRLSAEAAQEVWTQTGGHPCLAQFILYELWDDLPEITPQDVQETAAEFSVQVDHFERWSAALEPLAHATYRWLSECSDPVRFAEIRRAFATADGGDLQRALDALTYHGLINVTGRGRRTRYDVAGHMFRDWYRSDRPTSGGPGPTGEKERPGGQSPPAYDVLDLEIETRGPGRYEIQVVDAPTGPVRSSEVAFDPAEPQLQAMFRRVQVGDVDAALLTEIGQRLHAFLFPTPVLAAYAASREAARAHDRGLCLKLRLHQAELGALPWELLYDPREENFVALSNRTPLVRALPGVMESPLLPASPPWRLLLVTAYPEDLVELAVEREREAILNAVHPLVEAGRMTIDLLDRATPTALLAALRTGVHWLHFIGHGEYDEATGRGALVLEREDHTSTRLDVQTLRHLLPGGYERAGARLRLVFLNACATAQVGMTPGTRGLAQTLVQAGIPTTIGMGRPIADQSARAFSEGFYGALSQGAWPFHAAVTEGRRRAMVESGIHSGDWAVPLLFMRTL
jgi:hypothetical protein